VRTASSLAGTVVGSLEDLGASRPVSYAPPGTLGGSGRRRGHCSNRACEVNPLVTGCLARVSDVQCPG